MENEKDNDKIVNNKNTENENLTNHIDNTKILDIKVKEELEKSFIAYAMAVNVSRAIPDVRDGLNLFIVVYFMLWANLTCLMIKHIKNVLV